MLDGKGRLALRPVFLAAAIVALSAGPADSQVPPLPDIFSSPLPMGSGARAAGSGGAFLAVADDATAASWNPAGLVQLERPEFSVVLTNMTYGHDPDSGGTTDWSNEFGLNYLSAVYPFDLFGTNVVVSLNYQQEYDFTKEFEYAHAGAFSNGGIELEYAEQIEFDRDGGISSVTPACAVQVTPRFSLGAAVDFYVDERFGGKTYRQKTGSTGSGRITFPDAGDPTDFMFSASRTVRARNFSGTGATFGALYDLTPKCSVGFRLDIPFSAEADGVDEQHIVQTIITDTPSGLVPSTTETDSRTSADQRFRFPTTWGAGVAYRFSDALTLMGDVTRVEQDQFEIKQEGREWVHPATGDDSSDVDATHTVRLGAEYLIIRERVFYPIRCGVFYDQEPAAGHPNDYWGLALGSGLATDRFRIDAAYQLRMGNGVEVGGVDDRSFDTQEHMIVLSAIVYF